jgi:DNA modification methylase
MSLADYTCADEPAHVFAYHTDCLAFLRSLPDEWTHCIVTDPPYGLADHKPDKVAQAITAWAAGDRDRVPDGRGFMGREWDAFVPPPAVWDECLRVLKPGGHLAVFAGSRTVDLMGLSIRLAGFEMRDGIAAWLYGSGFPKSLDVSKAIDKAGGAERGAGAQVLAPLTDDDKATYNRGKGNRYCLTCERWTFAQDRCTCSTDGGAATDAAREWQGWGTALKPAHEPILLARKPLAGTVAANVLAHRTGGLHIDACRVATAAEDDIHAKNPHTQGGFGHAGASVYGTGTLTEKYDPTAGRWPTNVVLAHHPDCGPDEAPGPCAPGCQVAALDEQSGTLGAGNRPKVRNTALGIMNDDGWQPHRQEQPGERMDSGGASRFFPTFRYQAKAPRSERPIVDGRGHPTVKPLGLMRWLVRLLVPGPDAEGNAGCVLDPFAGSGATLEAARLEGRRAVGVERDEHSVRLIAERLGVEFREASPPTDDNSVTVSLSDDEDGSEETMGDTGKQVEATDENTTALDEIDDRVKRYKLAKELEKKAKDAAEDARRDIAAYLEARGAEFGTVDGDMVIRWRPVTQNRLDQKKLAENYPDAVAECTASKTSMRMEIV